MDHCSSDVAGANVMVKTSDTPIRRAKLPTTVETNESDRTATGLGSRMAVLCAKKIRGAGCRLTRSERTVEPSRAFFDFLRLDAD